MKVADGAACRHYPLFRMAERATRSFVDGVSSASAPPFYFGGRFTRAHVLWGIHSQPSASFAPAPTPDHALPDAGPAAPHRAPGFLTVVAVARQPLPPLVDSRAVEFGLPKPDVDFVVHLARPPAKRCTGRDVRGHATDNLFEVSGALGTRVCPGHYRDEISRVARLLTRGVLGVLRGESV